MKTRLFPAIARAATLSLALLAIVSVVPAARAAETREWQNLELEADSLLDQEIELPGVRGERLVLLEGARYSLAEIFPLEGLSVVQYVFAAEACAKPSEESEMELVLPEGGASGSEVGVQLVKDCRLEIFVEAKDLGRPSFFREP